MIQYIYINYVITYTVNNETTFKSITSSHSDEFFKEEEFRLTIIRVQHLGLRFKCFRVAPAYMS